MQNNFYDNNNREKVNETANPHISVRDEGLSKYYSLVYLIMFAGVAVTAFVSWLLAYPLRSTFLNFLSSGGSMGILITTFVPLILVFVMGHNANKDAPASQNLVLFLIMSACYGVTTSLTLLASSAINVVNALGVTALIFLLMSIVGRSTKNDLQRGRRTVFMLMLGVILISVINLFTNAPALQWILNYAILGIFTWMIASDQQNIKAAYYQMNEIGATSTTLANYATYSALGLYLDILNIFMVLIEIFGNGNNRN